MHQTKPDCPVYPATDAYGYHVGLTKRELLAAMAMQGLLAHGAATSDRLDDGMEAVRRADALITALNGRDD